MPSLPPALKHLKAFMTILCFAVEEHGLLLHQTALAVDSG